MRTISLFFAFVILTFNLFSAKEKEVKSKVDKVTVFLNTAQVFRSASFQAEQGVNQIIFNKVSPYLNQKSIQVKGKGNFTILDVQYRVKQPEPVAPNNTPLPPQIVKDIALLQDSISMLSFDIEELTNKKEVLKLEKEVLLSNKFMKGDVDTIPELKESMQYLRDQLNDINTQLMIVKRSEFKKNKEKNRMSKRLSDLQSYNSHVNPPVVESPKYQVVVTITASTSVWGSLTINYMVNNAGWSPAYDIRAKGVGQPIELVQKANVYQNSGEDWKGVMLTLSTIKPTQSLVKPYLNVLYLGYYQSYNYPASGYIRDEEKTPSMDMASGESTRQIKTNVPALSSANFAQVNQTMTNVEYEIDLPYDIPTDGQNHIVAVQNYDLKAEYEHYLIPRLEKTAYLIAKVVDWNTLDLLPGAANVYFEGTYVGETSINTSIMNDTLELALGRDRGVIVERKKVSDEVKNELIGSNVIQTFEYDIKIKNNKLVNLNLIVQDQIPMSNTEDIKVEKGDVADANYDETTGFLKWKITMNPKQNKTLTFSYSVEYNKNKQLASTN